MQLGTVLRLRTVSTLHFTGAIAQNAAEDETIVVASLTNYGGGGGGLSAGGHMKTRVHDIRILSVQNLAWAVELYGTEASFPENSPAIDDEIFLGRWEFQAADGRKDTADDYWKYWVPGLDMSFQDMSLLGQIYIRLINLSAAAKNAGPTGGIVIEFGLEPTQGI